MRIIILFKVNSSLDSPITCLNSNGGYR